MLHAPIVNEVRKAREEMFKKANYDLKILIKMLKENEQKSDIKVISRINKSDENLVKK